MKVFVLLIFFLMSSMSAWSAVTMSSLKLEDMEGLLPAFWFDHSGFEFENEPKYSADVPLTPVLPLLPLFSEGGFGKKTYVGGVVEEKYLKELDRYGRSSLIRKIREMRGPEGIRFQAFEFQGKIFGIRSDYQVVYTNSTSVAINISFGSSKTVNLGESKSYGLSLDFGAPFRVSPEKGFNLVGNLQKMIDDWSVGLSQDETRMIIDQSVAIAPALVSYLTERSIPLMSETGVELENISAIKNNELTTKEIKSESISGNFSQELNGVKKDISKNLKKEITWRDTVKLQVQSEKIVNRSSTNEFIQNICDRLAVMYEVPAEIWPRCKVSATLVPNAWAYPGGDIFITAGLLGILSEVDSVSLVLGHEIGHVMARHTSKQSVMRKTYNYAATILSTVVNVGLTAFSLGGGWGALGNVNFITWYPQAMASSVGGSYLAEKGGQIASFAPVAGLMLMSREYETQADRLGQEVAYASGADLKTMNQGWEEFVNFLDTNFPHKLGVRERIMQDHPAADKRLRNFEKRSDELSKTLSDFHHDHSYDSMMKEEYKRIHKSFKPYANAYGKALREKLAQIEEGKSDIKKERKLQNFMHTLVGPESLCIRHALGAQ